MASLCCQRCHEEHYYRIMRELMLRQPITPCTCSCHRGEGSLARGVTVGLLLVLVPWLIVGLLVWRALA